MNFKIDKGIPIPEDRYSLPRPDMIRTMEVGDSVLFEDRVAAQRASSMLNSQGRGAKIRIEGVGYRVWRIK